MQILEIDLSANHVTQIVTAKQGDVGRKFKVVLKDAGVVYTVPRGAQFSVWYAGPSGEGNYSAIGENSAFVVEGNTVVVELITQMLANAGTCSMCLVMTGADGSQLGLWNMVLIVEPVPGMGSAAAEQYYTALSEVAEKAVKAAETFQTDTTMKVSGRAADAAAVGTELAGKAPAGYGLGVSNGGTTVSDCNNAIKNGWYNVSSNAANAPWVNGSWLHVAMWSEDYGTQTLYNDSHGGIVAQRVKSGTWGEWEWVNPPMEVGKEYRTTERWNDKVVYTRLVNLGALPNNNAKTGSLGITTTGIVSIEAVAVGAYGNYILPCLNEVDSGNKISFWCSGTQVTVKTFGSGWDSYNLYVAVKYLKD